MSLQTVEKKEVYVKALFEYDAALDSGLPSKGLSFRYGDIIHVTNATDPEWWQGRLLITHPAADRPWEENFGIIPSKKRVERKERKRINQVKFYRGDREFTIQEFKESNPPNVTVETPTKKENRKKANQRSKAAKKQGLKGTRRFPFFKSCDDVSRVEMNGEKDSNEIQESQSVTSERPSGGLAGAGETEKTTTDSANSDDWILSYEAITEQDINYMRPIVILGPKKDQIMEDLVQDYPARFGVCIPHTTRTPRTGEVDGAVGCYYFVDRDEMEKQKEKGFFFEVGIHNNNLYGTSINSVIDVSKQGLHCVLDVRGDAIRELQKKNMYPIAIYVKPKIPSRSRQNPIEDQIAWLQELDKRKTRENCVKILEQAERDEAAYADCFTAAVSGDNMSDIYKNVLDVIDRHGQKRCWLPSGEAL